MNPRAEFVSHVGMKRKQNQDSGAMVPELGLFVVADGMGGHQGGEIASAMLVSTLVDHIKKSRIEGRTSAREALLDGIEIANDQIFRRAYAETHLRGMGTTTTAMLITEDNLTIGQVGDSRCYFLRPGHLWQVTRDHSLVQEKLRAGLITRDQLRTDQMKNVITRSVGFEPQVSVDIYDMRASEGDVFMICSDGLTGMVEDHDILKLVNEYLFEKGDLTEAVERLISLANENGGDDNVTVALIQMVA